MLAVSGRTRADRFASCTLNPAAGMEREFTITPSEGKEIGSCGWWRAAGYGSSQSRGAEGHE